MHRRIFLSGLPAVYLAASASGSSADDTPTIDHLVADLTKKMAEMHGGKWTCRQSPNFVLFQREL